MRHLVFGVNCWQCGTPVEALFCPLCKSLQQPDGDYFRFFGLPQRLSVDLADLRTRFYALSRQIHPDRFTRRSAQEQQISLEASSILNDGYRVLLDPVERAEYVLTRHGFDIGEQRTKDVPPELLEEVFELNMALEEMRSGDDSARPELEEAKDNFEGMLTDADNQLVRLFAVWDESQSPVDLSKIRGALNRRKYIQNLVRDVSQALQ